MLSDANLTPGDQLRESLRALHLADEDQVIDDLLPMADLGGEGGAYARDYAGRLVRSIRRGTAGGCGIDALLNEYSLSTEEGVALMCLAEALLRVPDTLTIDRLIRDKLQSGDWRSHLGANRSGLVNTATRGLVLTGRLLGWGDDDLRHRHGVLKRLAGRLGQPAVRMAVHRAMGIMGATFVMGRDIDGALARARRREERGYTYSYDMLGEGAQTAADAERYFQSYLHAIERIGVTADRRGPHAGPGISIKLSALHPRYHFAHRERVLEELVPRLRALAVRAKAYQIGFTVDAEECARLDLSLDVIEAVFVSPALSGWAGFGLAVQAYQKRALVVIEWARQLARAAERRLAVRLVKGAYWDTEIKLAQVEGLDDYPVFTRKASTDVSYLACARALLAYRNHLYPQFATHNAHTVAAILAMDDDRTGFEFQRLHGMGEPLYDQVMADTQVPCRIYAPVGDHRDLLAYLVRRLLENGANSSFVNNILDDTVAEDDLIADPVAIVRGWNQRRNPRIPLPGNLFGPDRPNAAGVSLSDPVPLRELQRGMETAWSHWLGQREPGFILAESNAKHPAEPQSACGSPEASPIQCAQTPVQNPARTSEIIGALAFDDEFVMERKLTDAHRAFPAWSHSRPWQRAHLLNRFADALEANRDELMMLCVKEAGKNLPDSLAEVREAVDFCRYYALQANQAFAGTHGCEPRGVVLCISPWNFPLAIFVGQMTAALAAGNTVIAKPAEQTSLIARRALALLHEVGVPENVAQLVVSPGKPAGERLVPDPRIQAVMFTGSTATGRWLYRSLANRDDAPIPLIAETGGQNAMIVDATALPEQVVKDVIRSGFQSAGQRCSALRLLFLQEEIADRVITMLQGAMAELSIGDPTLLATDVGPVIDDNALARLNAHTEHMQRHGRLLYQCALPLGAHMGRYFAPALYEIHDPAVLREEVFGPVVHVIRYRAHELDEVIDQINASGYGLTQGVHSRVRRTADHIANNASVGNVYINRDMIGAVVGVQPFGGRGLSGTGPKAGGPGYLRRLVYANGSHCARANSEQPVHVLDDLLGPVIRYGSAMNPTRCLFPQPGRRTLALCSETLRRIREAVGRAVPLPGPTGEANTLHYQPRGRLAAFYTEKDDPIHCLTTTVAALGCGNGLSLYVPASWKRWLDCLIAALHADDPDEGRVAARSPGVNVEEFPPTESLSRLLTDPRINGVVIPPASVHRAIIARALAERPGSLTTVICELPGAFYLYRFLVEKTVTVDTTAAGGNASLLTLGDGNMDVEAGRSATEPARQAAQ